MGDLKKSTNKHKINKGKSILSNILLVICICVFCYSGYKIGKNFYDTYKSKKENNELSDIFYGSSEEQIDNEDKINDDPTPTPEPETLEEKFARLTKLNSDIKAWINVVNTNIDYAVVQASDNDYYLRRNIYKKYSYSGSIFMDYRCSIVDDATSNIIIYGHNMKADNMFHELQKYKKESFFGNKDNIITLYTADGTVTATVFSVYVTDTSFDYLQSQFSSDETYKAYLDSITSKSLFASSVNVTTDDRIITLSTCDYDFDDARLVIHAKISQ